jgi:multidrug transporter EmrE-like cation transporter
LLLTGRKKFNIRNVIAGICLGVPNYFSIYFLVKALQSPAMSSSATIPINNIGVLLVVSLFGIMVFKEKLSKKNYMGLGLTLLAIFLIYLGDKAA